MKDSNKFYICNIHRQYARYKEKQDFLMHLEMEHGIDIKNDRLIRNYLKTDGVWVDKSLNKGNSN